VSSTATRDQIRRDCEFRLRLVDGGYTAREVIPPGDELYDPQVRWAEEDGSVVISDIGGQAEPGWDPEAGHGAIYRLRPDDSLATIVPKGMDGAAAPLRPMLAPRNFGAYGGHIFFVAQQHPGKGGAHKNHCVYRVGPGESKPVVFGRYPSSGTIGDGIAGAGMPGAFGREGSPDDGYFYCQSLMNCTIYRLDTSGGIEPYLVMGPPLLDRPCMPLFVEYAPDYGPFAPWAGELVVTSRTTSYLDSAPARTDVHLFWLDRNGPRVEPLPESLPRIGPIAPAEFGPFGGQMFTVDEGSTNMLHTDIDKSNAAALPYDGRILRVAPDGSVHTFADRIQGGSTTIVFSGSRMVIGSVRKSYSSGEYHEPDGSIYEITPA